MTYSLGVDLGTTTSAAALRRSSGLEVCRLGDLTATMPSVVLQRADGSLLVGEAAADRAPYDPTLVARHVTAHLDDDGPVMLDGRPHDAARLTQALLETVIDRVRRLHGDRPHDLVLTYPLFRAGGSPALLERVGAATVGRTTLIPHPVAAAAKLAHDVEIAVGTTVAVLDLGGGTFEATIVRRTDNGFDVVGPPGGLADLGGVEFDDAVFARVDAELGHVLQNVPRDDVDGMAALRRLRAACRSAKEWLSSSPDTTVEVALPNLSTWVPIRRADLERDIRPSLMAAVDVVAQTIAASGLAPADVHVALLVGGSSRIPLFAELVSSRLGLPIAADPFPELTVALGAALFGGGDTTVPPPPLVAPGARATPPSAPPGGGLPGGPGDGPAAGAGDGFPGGPSDDPAAEAGDGFPGGPGDDPAAGAGDDVGVLAAWFADPATGPTHAAAGAPGPGSAVPWDALPDGPPADDGTMDSAAWAGVDGAVDAVEEAGAWTLGEGATGWDAGEDSPGDPPWDAGEVATGWDAGEDATGWDAGEGDAWDSPGDPPWDAGAGQAEVADWEGGEWSESVGHWDEAPEVATAAAFGRRGATTTTGETDLWGPPPRRRRGRPEDDDDEGGPAPPGDDKDDGGNPRLIAAIIGGALAIVGIAGVALATGMGGPDDHQLTLADPARTEITTTTTAPTGTEPPATSATEPPTPTTTTTDLALQQVAEAPPSSMTEPPSTAPPSTTTTAPPPTTTTTRPRPTTTTAPPTTTTTCPRGLGPKPSTTTTTMDGC
jgi:Hsp70 protein